MAEWEAEEFEFDRMYEEELEMLRETPSGQPYELWLLDVWCLHTAVCVSLHSFRASSCSMQVSCS